jgi:hypothetical protein
MIRPLRRRHRTMMVLLAVVVPALFVAGVMVRPTPPLVPELILDSPGSRVEVAAWADDLWHGTPILTGMGDDAWVLDLPQRLVTSLLYFVPETATEPVSSLPGEAVLLGSLTASRSVLRRASGMAQGGTLIIYDLERQEVAAWTALSTEVAS